MVDSELEPITLVPDSSPTPPAHGHKTLAKKCDEYVEKLDKRAWFHEVRSFNVQALSQCKALNSQFRELALEFDSLPSEDDASLHDRRMQLVSSYLEYERRAKLLLV